MRLERIRIRNYRSIEDLTIYFPPNKPVILFGSNNAGKSNILSAILNLRRFDSRYAVETQWNSLPNGTSIYDTSILNGTMIIQDHLDPLTAKFANSGASSRGCDSTTEITLTVDLGSHKEQIEIGFCEFNDYLPYVKNSEVLQKLPLPTDSGISFIQVWESGSGDPSYYLDYLKTTRGENDNGSPEWFLKLLPEIAKKGSDSIKGIKEFDRFPQGKGENAPADLFFVGSGQQAWVGRFGDLAAASVIKSAVDDLQLVLMDEPETHLHPNAEAQLWEKIQTASEDGVQVILTTHSENFLCMEDLEGFVRVYKENGVTKACQLTKTELNSTLDKNFGGVENYYSVHFFSDQMKGFFADTLLFVEGPTEYFALPEYLSEEFLAKNGIQIINCRGKASIPLYWRLFNAYGYKCFILFDHDNSTISKIKERTYVEKDKEKRKQLQGQIESENEKNQKLEGLCHFKASDNCLYSMSSIGACFKDNWDIYFEEALGDDYQTIKTTLQKMDVPFEKDKNKQLRAKAIAQEIKNQHYTVPPFISAIKARLKALSEMSINRYHRLKN